MGVAGLPDRQVGNAPVGVVLAQVESTAQPANPPSFEAGESTHQPSLAVSPHTDTTSTVATSQQLVSARRARFARHRSEIMKWLHPLYPG